MGTTTTPNYGLIKPDSNEPASNWPTQVASNMTTLDSTLVQTLQGSSSHAANTSNILLGGGDTTFAPGSPVVGYTFVAPPSGRIKVTIGAWVQSSINTKYAQVGYEVRQGAIIGSGTIEVPAIDIRSVTTSRAVNTGAAALINATYGPRMHTGLTPGATYNIRAMHRLETGSTGGEVNDRYLLVEPAI